VSRIASRDAALVRVTGRLSRSDLLWVANTAHGPGGHWHARVRGGEPDHDHLESPEAALRYLVQRLLWPGADPWTDEGRALLAAARYALDAEGRIVCTQTGWRAFCRDLLVPLLALVENRAGLRRCANPACRLLFEDGSPNHARRWCDTAGCGNRDRVRRARSRDAVAPTSRARPGASNP